MFVFAAIFGAMLLTLIVGAVLLIDARKRLAALEREWPEIRSRVRRDAPTVRMLRDWYTEHHGSRLTLLNAQPASPVTPPGREVIP